MALRGRLSVARIVVPMMLMVAVGVSGVAAQAKVALVIGNGDYSSLSRLNNPPNDARDVAAALRRRLPGVSGKQEGAPTEAP